MKMMDAHAGEVEEVYGGPVGLIWEMLAGEDADGDLDVLAERAGLARGALPGILRVSTVRP